MKNILTHKSRGSNQYKAQYPNLRAFFFTCGIIISLIFVFINRWVNNNIVIAVVSSSDVYASSPRTITVTPTATPIPSPSELEEIVAYITRVFEPEGKHVAVWAIKCFYSESDLNPVRVNSGNSNGSIDYGIAQVNSVHGISKDELMNFYKNIDAAYKIYKSQGKSAWYGKDCK